MISQTNVLQSTTQKYLEIFDITNDVVIMQDGSCSIVLKTSAINFDLFSEDEQDATIYAYASLLNSLSFPIEIMIRSQRKDVTNYLELLKQQEAKAYTPLKKKQIRDYRAFVEQLVQERNVLDKKFYIVLTYTAIELGIASATTVIPTVGKKQPAVFDKYAILEKALINLQPRADHLIHQCARIGLYAQQLNTQELIQLFYTIYNPEAAEGQKVADAFEYTSPLVQADLHSASPTNPPIQPQQAQTANEQNTQPLPLNMNTVTQVPNNEISQQLNTQLNTPLPTQPQNQVPVQILEPTNIDKLEVPSVSLPISNSIINTSQQINTNQGTPTTNEQTISNSLKEDSFILNTDLKPPTPPAQTASSVGQIH